MKNKDKSMLASKIDKEKVLIAQTDIARYFDIPIEGDNVDFFDIAKTYEMQMGKIEAKMKKNIFDRKELSAKN